MRRSTVVHRGAAGLAAFMALAGGCAQQAKTGDLSAATPGIREVSGVGLDNALAATEEVRPPNIGAMNEAESIAAQFERDMADLRALREGAPNRGADGAGAPSPSPGAQPRAAEPRRVIFNDPPARGAAGSAAASATPGRPITGLEVASPEDASTAAADGLDIPAELTSPSGTPEAQLSGALVSLRRVLYQDASYADSPLRQYLVMAALAMVDPDRAIDPDAFHDLSDRERELLRAYQSFFLKIGAELREEGDEQALVSHLDDLRLAVLNKGPLKIARAELCTRVDGFGRFQTFDKYAFLAGVAQEVVVYSEIEEFTSTQNDKGEWRTNLQQELVVYSANDNVPVWHQEWQEASDIASRKRTDFYISHLVTLPARFSIGGYILKVRVRDEQTGSVAEAGIPFQVVAHPKLAATIR